jgi:hypothetical protein
MEPIKAPKPVLQAAGKAAAIPPLRTADAAKSNTSPAQQMIKLQRSAGNHAVTDLIKSKAGSSKTPTAEQVLAEAEHQNDVLGGTSVAFYVSGQKLGHKKVKEQKLVHNKKTNKDELKDVMVDVKPVEWVPIEVEGASEFLKQARQFASDHIAIGVQDGSLRSSEDAAMELRRTVPELLSSLYASIDAARTARGDPAANRKPIRIRTLAIFTHGWEQNLKAHVIKGPNSEPLAAELTGQEKDESGKPTGRSVYTAFVNSIGDHLSPYGQVILYACRTAGLSNEDNPKQKVAVPLAAGLASGIQDRIKQTRGLSDTQVSIDVWGHLDSGHTTANSRLAKLHGLDSTTDSRTELAPFMADMALQLVLARTLVFRNPDQYQTLTGALWPELYEESLKGMRETFTVSKKQTGPDDPRNVFNREIPLLGLHRIFRDLSAGWLGAAAASKVTDISQIPLSPEARAALQRGLDRLRPQFVGVLNNLQARIRKRSPAGSQL